MSNDLDNIIGATVLAVEGCNVGSESILFRTDKGTLRLYHVQNCCESVSVEDVNGDPSDLVGGVVSVAEERTNVEEDSWQRTGWTFYTIRTTKGDLDIRWLGRDNGYYGVLAYTRWYEEGEDISDW